MGETGTEQVGRRERGIVEIYCAQCSVREMREARFREAVFSDCVHTCQCSSVTTELLRLHSFHILLPSAS